MDTCWPKTDGLTDEASVVALFACCTTNVTTLLVLIVGELESETDTVKVKAPAVAGVPVIAPVAALSVRPPGSAGTAHV